MKQQTNLKTALQHLVSSLFGTLGIVCRHTLVTLSFLIIATSSAQASETTALKNLKSGNHFAIMRHSFAPGMGDPVIFDLNDCSTQRNLSEQGIEQAESIGNKFRDSGIKEARVFTSEWCRCIDTAESLDLGVVKELPLLNSFFQNQGKSATQTQSLIVWLAKQDLSTPMILVTHQVNITGLTDVYPASGEIIIVKRDEKGALTVTDRVQTN